MSVSGDVVVVGEWRGFAGAAYVFRWNGSTWVEEQQLLASDGAVGDRFGCSVSVSGNVLVVGAMWHDENGNKSGSAFAFHWNGSSWVEEQQLSPSDAAVEDEFGVSVSVSGNVAVVGSRFDDDNGNASGSAYVFRWDGSAWVEGQKLLPSDGAASDQFGNYMSISGDVAVVGARGDDDNGSKSGSAYSFAIVTCGDGLVTAPEDCDDGGVAGGDGCSSTCTVESGYSCDAGEPTTCTDNDECDTGTNNCDVNATCSNTPGSFTCTCNEGFVGNGVTCIVLSIPTVSEWGLGAMTLLLLTVGTITLRNKVACD